MAEPTHAWTKTSVADGPCLATSRLEIIAATLPLLKLEVSSPATLASALDADLETWPPPLNDAGSLRWTCEKLRANPGRVGFFSWYVVLTNEQRRKLIGLVAFKGPPDNDGMIETGYSVLQNYQKQGIGTEATCAIMQWAFENPSVRRIDAETFS